MPTVAFQVIVDHTTKIMAVSPCAYPGSHSDMHISRLDLQLNLIRFGALFVYFAFSLFVAADRMQEFYGVYLIADGGYQCWRVLQQTDKTNSDPYLRPFLSQVASARKDVECTFGRLKNRFRSDFLFLFCCTRDLSRLRRLLKLPQTGDNLSDVHKLFVTCCVFHNMLLIVDQPFNDFQPHVSDILGNTVSSRPYSSSGIDVVIGEDTDVTGVGMRGASTNSPMFFHDGSSEPSSDVLRDHLANHYNVVNPQPRRRE